MEADIITMVEEEIAQIIMEEEELQVQISIVPLELQTQEVHSKIQGLHKIMAHLEQILVQEQILQEKTALARLELTIIQNQEATQILQHQEAITTRLQEVTLHLQAEALEEVLLEVEEVVLLAAEEEVAEVNLLY